MPFRMPTVISRGRAAAATVHRLFRRPLVRCLVVIPAVLTLLVGPMVLFPSTSLTGAGGGYGGGGGGLRLPAIRKEGYSGRGAGEREEEAQQNVEIPQLPRHHAADGGGSEAMVVTTAVQDRAGFVIPLNHHLSENTLTVVLMSYPKSSRFAVLIKILQKVVTWAFVEEVVLVWNGRESEVPPILMEVIATINAGGLRAATEGVGDGGERNGGRGVKGGGVSSSAAMRVRLVPQEYNRIDNRWRLAGGIKTQAVLNMDDDVNLFEDGARCMFNVWKSSPQSIVSVDVRSHFSHVERSKGATSKSSFGPWGYIARDTFSDPNTAMAKKYSIGLPRVLLTSRQHLIDYNEAWEDESSGLRDIVDRLLCDDIAFNFVSANRTEERRKERVAKGGDADWEGVGGAAGVIYAKAHFEPYPESHSKDALFNQKGMKEIRQRCVNELAGKFGMSLRARSWHLLCSVDG